jgi:hypothetical protein
MKLLPNKQIAYFLNIELVKTELFSIDIWHIVHLFTGFVLMKFFLINLVNPFLWLFVLLVAYEVFELYVISTGSKLFRPESILNILLDVLIGMLGGLIAITI